jgi:hypothetical protein
MGIFNRIAEVVKTIRFSASPRLYGRGTAGAGNGEEISLGTRLSITGNVLNAAATAWADVTGKPSTFAPSSHTHTSADILDATDTAVAGKILKLDEFGVAKTQGVTSTTYVRCGDAEATDGIGILMPTGAIFEWVRGNNESLSILPPVTVGQYTYTFPSGTGTFAFHPTGPYANDAAAASANVAIGRLYYTAAGAVLRRMA